MRHPRRSPGAHFVACSLIACGLAAGCHKNEPVEETPAEAARQALGVQEQEGKEKSVEVKRDVLVKQTTEVVDQQTGEVITTEKKVTPVTVEKEKTVDTDVNVNVGDTQKTVD